MNKIKRYITGAGVIAGTSVIGIIGGMDQNYISVENGLIICGILLFITASCIYIGNLLDKETKHNRQQINILSSDYCNYIITH